MNTGTSRLVISMVFLYSLIGGTAAFCQKDHWSATHSFPTPSHHSHHSDAHSTWCSWSCQTLTASPGMPLVSQVLLPPLLPATTILLPSPAIRICFNSRHISTRGPPGETPTHLVDSTQSSQRSRVRASSSTTHCV